jgi:dolichyl-phosphate-mannose-protein mannosyltransferase
VPFLVFVASFQSHFMVLNHNGPDDAQESSFFQAHLIRNIISRNPLGTVKHFLAFHLLFAPIATSGTKSPPRMLVMEKGCSIPIFRSTQWVNATVNYLLSLQGRKQRVESVAPMRRETPVRFLKHNAVVRLSHGPMGCNLHSHTIPVPV